MERETNAVRKKAKNDDIIGDNDLLELLDKYIDLKIYMSEVMEGDSYAAPLDRSNHYVHCFTQRSKSNRLCLSFDVPTRNAKKLFLTKKIWNVRAFMRSRITML